MNDSAFQRHQPQPCHSYSGEFGPRQGPMELATLTQYLARAHNNSCNRSARWGHQPTNAYLEAWNWCKATAAGLTTGRPSWLSQRAINAINEFCPLDFI